MKRRQRRFDYEHARQMLIKKLAYDRITLAEYIAALEDLERKRLH